ncbi:MAG: hypothetical protein LBG72_02105 [Spirochaetaceae bacterium]|jgi:hypothetical protein|nr:hypothetical protein [Spirochaetaceae bacterium]
MVKVPRQIVFVTALLSAWLVFAVIFAGFFVIAEQQHDHTGKNCRVCLELQIAQRLIEAFALAGAAVLLARFVKSVTPIKRQVFIFAATPLTLKVKLNC